MCVGEIAGVGNLEWRRKRKQWAAPGLEKITSQPINSNPQKRFADWEFKYSSHDFLPDRRSLINSLYLSVMENFVFLKYFMSQFARKNWLV